MESTVRLTAAEETALAPLAKAGDRPARERLLSSVNGLVHWFAAQMERPGVDREDLAQAGFVGALEAIEGFDPARGRWHSWAAVFVKGAMKAARGRDRLVPIPAGKRTLARRYRAAVEALRERDGFEPEPEDVRAAMNISAEQFGNVLAAAKGPASKPFGGAAAADMVPAKTETTEADALAEEQALAAIRTGLRAVLDPRAADVFYATVFEDKAVWKLAARFNANHAAIKRAKERAVERLRDVIAFTAVA